MDNEFSRAAIGQPVLPAAAWMALACGTAACVVVAGCMVRRWLRGLPFIDRRPGPHVCWTGGDVVTAMLCFFAFQGVAATVLPADAAPLTRLVAGIVAMVVFTACTMLMLTTRGYRWRAIGIDRIGDGLQLGVAGLLLLLVPLLVMAEMLNRLVPYRHTLVDFLREHRDAGSIGMVVLAAVVVAPVAEELLFRRVIQSWLEMRLGAGGFGSAGMLAVTLSALAFAAVHAGQGLAWVPLFFFGLVVGYLARQTGSIVPGIILHGLFNAVSVFLVVAQTGR